MVLSSKVEFIEYLTVYQAPFNLITLGQNKSDNNKYNNINQEDFLVSCFFWKIDHINRMKTLTH
jgi:hypothetical protein